MSTKIESKQQLTDDGFVQLDNSWLCEELTLFSNLYAAFKLNYKENFYAITEPFKMDSQYNAEQQRPSFKVLKQSTSVPNAACLLDLTKPEKQESLEEPRSQSSSEDAVAENSVGTSLQQKLVTMLPEIATRFGAVKQDIRKVDRSNRRARLAAEIDSGPAYATVVASQAEVLAKRCPSCTITDAYVSEKCALQTLDVMEYSKFVTALVTNNRSEGRIVSIGGYGMYLIPANSQFILGDVYSSCFHLTHRQAHFDVIIMDPPWLNKSVIRKRSYCTEAESKLLQLPINLLLKPDGLLAIWITNSSKLHKFAIEVLLPSARLELAATWYWLKLTRTGEPVCAFSAGSFKQPYECILIARRKRSSVLLHGTKNASSTSEQQELIEIPDKQVIFSVPNSCHSRKPPLLPLLNKYIHSTGLKERNDEPKCLELFARYLFPHTLSVGNEVLKFQHMSYFEPTVLVKNCQNG